MKPLKAQILLTLYSVFITVAAQYGFGKSVADIDHEDDVAKAILFEAIAQTFSVVGMAVAKWSLGVFLLRLVQQRSHIVSIWVVLACLMGASISTCFVFWLQCTPPAYLWDRRIPGGYCQVDSAPVAMLLSSTFDVIYIIHFFGGGLSVYSDVKGSKY